MNTEVVEEVGGQTCRQLRLVVLHRVEPVRDNEEELVGCSVVMGIGIYVG